MSEASAIKVLFIDIGGVLLTNGWGSKSRQKAAEQFSLDLDELNERHHIIFDTYESGKMSLDEYLQMLVFYEDRPFAMETFKEFMCHESQPFPDMIKLIKNIKLKYNLKAFAVNNEGRELNEYRIHQFGLKSIFDAFISSCFVHFRKPDIDIYNTALDIAQVSPEQTIYIDDRYVFIETARKLGLNCIHHTNVELTKDGFAKFGLSI